MSAVLVRPLPFIACPLPTNITSNIIVRSHSTILCIIWLGSLCKFLILYYFVRFYCLASRNILDIVRRWRLWVWGIVHNCERTNTSAGNQKALVNATNCVAERTMATRYLALDNCCSWTILRSVHLFGTKKPAVFITAHYKNKCFYM